MKLVAVSVVKNEADVIEAFVRHTRYWTDEHFIFDHDSTDGTREILFELVREGLPLKLFTGAAVGNLQQSRSNHLAHLAFTEARADWVLPLDADEFLVAESRAALESQLGSNLDEPVTLPLRNYSPSTVDNPAEQNPVLRIQHRKPGDGTTQKIMIPRALGLRTNIRAGKGNHALYSESLPLPARPLQSVWLAHFALRSPHQQVLRVVTAELQKLSRGRAHEGLDVHYRLGFQLLAEDADLFFATVVQPPERLLFDPAVLRGESIRYPQRISAFARSARALIPFLEKLARSHGELVDAAAPEVHSSAERIEPLLPPARSRLAIGADGKSFSGFRAESGWQPEEGPIPEAFLPQFHWATAPETTLVIESPDERHALLSVRALSYAEAQKTTIVLNGETIHELAFPRVNQMETLTLPLSLKTGDNRLLLRHEKWIESAADPRKLAVIFLRLSVDLEPRTAPAI
jgi:hypothetical protein